MAITLNPVHPNFVADAQQRITKLAETAEHNNATLAKVHCSFSVGPKVPSPIKQKLHSDHTLLFHIDLTKKPASYSFTDELDRIKKFIGDRSDLFAECKISGFDLKGRVVILTK